MRKRLIAVIMACAMSVSAGMVPVWADEEPIYWEFVTDGTEGLPVETAAHHYDFVLVLTSHYFPTQTLKTLINTELFVILLVDK